MTMFFMEFLLLVLMRFWCLFDSLCLQVKMVGSSVKYPQ